MALEVSRVTLFEHDEMFDDGSGALRSAHSRLTGVWARVDLVALDDGTHKATARIREHRVAFRASGEAYGYWTTKFATSVAVTQQRLVLRRTTKQRFTTSQYVFDTEPTPDLLAEFKQELIAVVNRGREAWTTYIGHDSPEVARISEANQRALEHFTLPKHADRYPLLGTWETHAAWLDSTDLSQVAKKLFGVQAYRRPLVAQVERFQLRSEWFALFRGLVPTEWLVDAMEATATDGVFAHNTATMREMRRILVRTPQPILRRILREPQHVVIRSLSDAARHSLHRDLDLLPGLIEQVGQRRIRGVVDLERLISQLPQRSHKRTRGEATTDTLKHEAQKLADLRQYERFAERSGQVPPTWSEWSSDATLRDAAMGALREAEHARQAEEERDRREQRERANAESAAWCREMISRLAGETVCGMDVVLADDSATLLHWGSVMSNCIGSYTSSLGLSLFLALVDADGSVRANVMVSRSVGVQQALGRYNQSLAKEFKGDAQNVVDELSALGLRFTQTTWGTEGLRVETQAVAA